MLEEFPQENDHLKSSTGVTTALLPSTQATGLLMSAPPPHSLKHISVQVVPYSNESENLSWDGSQHPAVTVN